MALVPKGKKEGVPASYLVTFEWFDKNGKEEDVKATCEVRKTMTPTGKAEYGHETADQNHIGEWVIRTYFPGSFDDDD